MSRRVKASWRVRSLRRIEGQVDRLDPVLMAALRDAVLHPEDPLQVAELLLDAILGEEPPF